MKAAKSVNDDATGAATSIKIDAMDPMVGFMKMNVTESSKSVKSKAMASFKTCQPGCCGKCLADSKDRRDEDNIHEDDEVGGGRLEFLSRRRGCDVGVRSRWQEVHHKNLGCGCQEGVGFRECDRGRGKRGRIRT